MATSRKLGDCLCDGVICGVPYWWCTDGANGQAAKVIIIICQRRCAATISSKHCGSNSRQAVPPARRGSVRGSVEHRELVTNCARCGVQVCKKESDENGERVLFIV